MSSEANTSEFNRDKFARLLFHSLLTKILMILLRLTRNAIIARILGPTDRGLLALIMSVPEIMMNIGNIGYANAAAYQLAQQGTRPRDVMGAVLAFIAIVGSLCAAISFWVVENPWIIRDNQDGLSDWKWIIAIVVPLLLIKAINHNLMLVREQVTQANLIDLNESLLPLVFFLVLWGIFDINGLAASLYAWFTAVCLLVFWSSVALRDMYPPQWNKAINRSILSYGVRGHFDTLFQKLLFRLDYLFVSALVGTTAVGYYAMATAAAELLLVLPNAVTFPLYSFLLRNHRDDKRAVTPMVTRIMLTGMVLGAIALWFLGEWLLLLLFGKEFLPAYPALVWLLPGMVSLGYTGVIRLDLLGENHPGSIAIILGICVALNATLNLTLTPLYGIEGTAAAATISYVLAAIALAFLHRRVTGIPIMEGVLITRSDIVELWRYGTQKLK